MSKAPRVPSTGYRASHHRVVAVFGPASNFRCVDCTEQARDWSYGGNDPEEVWGLSGHRSTKPVAYSAHPKYYQPRCRSCHKLHDQPTKESTE